MPRYIDADKLIAHLKDEIKECEIPFGSRANGKGIAYGTALGLKSAISFAETLSTADVVPKSEVDLYRKQVDELEDELASTYDKLENAKAEIERLKYNLKAVLEEIPETKREFASEIFAEIDKNFILISIYDIGFKELKKKYTEGEDKPASEEKYFSPEDVRKMTNQEVREKYTAIRRSMERW